jgi:hypothetical protein
MGIWTHEILLRKERKEGKFNGQREGMQREWVWSSFSEEGRACATLWF